MALYALAAACTHFFVGIHAADPAYSKTFVGLHAVAAAYTDFFVGVYAGAPAYSNFLVGVYAAAAAYGKSFVGNHSAGPGLYEFIEARDFGAPDTVKLSRTKGAPFLADNIVYETATVIYTAGSSSVSTCISGERWIP